MSPEIEVIIGTYEEFLLGYKVVQKENDGIALTQSFADKSHAGSIRCLAVHGKWIATGSTDDRIFVYDMQTRKQTQILLSHEGTVNALGFTPDETHLLSGGDDGHMFATRIGTWRTEANWRKAHNGSAVTHISCHPSGKLALSLGSDLVLRTWNLVKGRVAYKTNLKSKNTLGYAPDCLAWSLTGDHFTITGQLVVEIWSIKTADVMLSKKTPSKPVSLCWIADDALVVGLENGKILWLTLNEEEEKEVLIEAHNARVKAITFHKGVLVTASSSGEIKMWQVNVASKKLKELCATNIGCRPICLGILDLEQFGPNYVLSETITEAKEVTKSQPKKNTKLERGTVTVEYENDDDKDDDNDDDKEVEEEEDEVEDVSNNASEDTESSEDDDDDSESEEEKPKSRKRKIQIKAGGNQGKQRKMEKNSNQKKLKTPGAEGKKPKTNKAKKNVRKQKSMKTK